MHQAAAPTGDATEELQKLATVLNYLYSGFVLAVWITVFLGCLNPRFSSGRAPGKAGSNTGPSLSTQPTTMYGS